MTDRRTKAELVALLTTAEETIAHLEGKEALSRQSDVVRDKWLRRTTAAAIPTMGAMLGWGSADIVAHEGIWSPGLLPLTMTLMVLSVSLPHVAKGLKRALNLKGSREAWFLAVAVDLSMVVSEFMLHLGHEGPVWWTVMGIGLVGSTAFNLRGFEQE